MLAPISLKYRIGQLSPTTNKITYTGATFVNNSNTYRPHTDGVSKHDPQIRGTLKNMPFFGLNPISPRATVTASQDYTPLYKARQDRRHVRYQTKAWMQQVEKVNLRYIKDGTIF